MRCRNCKLDISGSLKRCPLCDKELFGEVSDNVFPKIEKKRDSFFKKMLLFISLTICIISFFLEQYITSKFFISKYIIFGVVTNFILVLFILNNYKNIIKAINRYFLIIMLLLIGWYILTKSLIITTYFIPILCMVIYAINSIIMIAYKNSFIIKYTRTIIIDSIVGLIPLVFIYLDLLATDLVVYISVVLNAITFLGLLIFFKDNVIEELKRIFNI